MYRIIIFVGLFFISSQAWATTWYVRVNGGNTSQCTGTTNADYPGSGTGQACAFSNPMYVGGAGCGNTGGNTCDVSAKWGNGDTIDIDGDNGSAQAQYPIGYDSTGVVTPTNGSNCSAGGSENCTMSNLPDGATIQTTPGSVHQAQLWGREHIAQIINDNYNASIGNTINNLEITQHSSCVYQGSDPNHSTGGFPNVCANSSPYGPWALAGMSLTGTNITIENNWIHGIAQWGVTTGSLSGLTESGNTISGNGGGGFGIGQNDSGSTINFNGATKVSNETIVFNGCGEVYPMHSSDPFDTLNYHNCSDDTSGHILADGWACEASSCDLNSSDTVTLTNVNVSYNTKGGIDNLHMNATGTLYAYRVRAEGNESQQMKINYASAYVENSQLINDCNYFQGQPFETIYDFAGNLLPNASAGSNWDFCRAGGNTIRIAVQGSGVYNVSNSTLYSNGGNQVELPGDVTCTSSERVNLNNNLFINAPDHTYNGGTNTEMWENDTGIGSCNPIVENYNLDYEDSNPSLCAGSHDICNNPSNAAVTGSFALNANGNTTYNLTGLATQMYPSPSGALVGAANSSLVLTGSNNDYNNVSRGVLGSWTIGSYQVNSCVASTQTCLSSECCSPNSCSSSNTCTGSCSSNGQSCSGSDTGNTTCCSQLCQTGSCVSCLSNSQACTTGAQCCTGICTGSICTPPPSGTPNAEQYQCIISGKTNIGGQTKT